jgi:hypothetical protein
MVSLDLVLIGCYLIPAIMAVVHGGELVSRLLAGALLALGTWLALRHNHNFVASATSLIVLQALCITALALCIVIAVRLRTKVLGTAMIVGSALQLAIALRIVVA